MNAREPVEVAGDLYPLGVDGSDRDAAGERQRDVGHNERADLEAGLEEQIGGAVTAGGPARDADAAPGAEVRARRARDVIEESPPDLECVVIAPRRVVE